MSKIIESGKRLRSPERREQIIRATLELIVENGLTGTTIGRIAPRVGISEPALYRHFRNRSEILHAALEDITMKLLSHVTSPEPNVIERIRQQSEALYASVMSHPEESKVLFEFICAPPAENLRERVQASLLGVIQYAQEILREGVCQGSLREDLDCNVYGWEIFSLGFTLYFASLLGLESALTRETALAAVENILKDIEKK